MMSEWKWIQKTFYNTYPQDAVFEALDKLKLKAKMYPTDGMRGLIYKCKENQNSTSNTYFY